MSAPILHLIFPLCGRCSISVCDSCRFRIIKPVEKVDNQILSVTESKVIVYLPANHLVRQDKKSEGYLVFSCQLA